MAAKLLHSLADDNPDLQKQIGCMTGIFQIFDRQNVLTGRRLSHRRLPPGDSHLNTGCSERQSFKVYQRPSTPDMNLNQNLNEKQRISMESSRASFSSSCSSMSSLDGYRAASQPEASSYDRIIFPETPSRDAVLTQPASTSPHLERQFLDLRDVVKDAMYREARGLSVKTASKEEPVGQAAKHKDTQRPLQPSKTADGSYGNGKRGKQNASADMRESLRVFAKLGEAPWYYSETRERPRSSYEPKDDAPRFSYDGREMNRMSFESRDTIKSAIKLKELPRLSLDGREKSTWEVNSDEKSWYAAKDLQNDGNSNEQLLGTQKRPPGVVAKLMGLEALRDSASASSCQSGLSKSFPVENGDSFPTPLRRNPNRPIQIPKSPRSLAKEPISPRWKNPDLIMKPISRLPIESAPWKQAEGTRASQKPVKVSAKTPNPFPTVYCEIEKRLKDLEFSQSGKDLRALKQILEAMQAKGLLETRKEEQGSNFSSQNNAELNCTSPRQKPRLLTEQNQHNGLASSSRIYDSPIVIMKPAKLVEKSSLPASSVIPMDGFSILHKTTPRNGQADNRNTNIRTLKDQSPRISHRDSVANSSDKKTNVRNRSTQSSTRLQQSPKESTTGSVKSSGSVSPRLQQKKLELERKCRPPTPPDSSKPRRQSYKMSTESSSPGGKNRPKSHRKPQNDDQLSQISNESRTSSHQGDDTSQQSDSTLVLDLKADVEVSSVEQSSELNDGQISSMRTGNQLVSVTKPKKSFPRQEEDGTLAEIRTLDAPEHPSPVSVLDASVYRDDTLSPVKQTPHLPTGDGLDRSNNGQSEKWNPTDNVLSGSRKKLQNIDNLVKKLRRLNSTHDEASNDYIASLCENSNPDHRYISEILLASGLLLRDLDAGMTTFQLHPSGHPINPELFYVLEQTKASSTLLSKEDWSPTRGTTCMKQTNLEKLHRKLIFDSVNEMIVKKLALIGGCGEPWLKSDKLAKKSLSAQKLLKEVCSHIEMVQAKKPESSSLEEEEDGLKGILWDDVMNGWEKWTDFNGEISGVVLDVERSIFKDLVDEIVIRGATVLRNKPVRRRQLFEK